MSMKREIDKAVGQTDESKERVWQKLQHPKRKNRKPLFISLAASVVASIVILLFMYPFDDEQATTKTPSNVITDIAYPELSFTSLKWLDESPLYIEMGDFALMASNKEQLNHYLQYIDVDLPNIDFDKQFVLFTSFSADSCGLEISRIEKYPSSFRILLTVPELETPLDIKSAMPDESLQGERFCLTYSKPFVEIIAIDKFEGYEAFNTVEFIGHDIVTINELKINETFYNFSELLQFDNIEQIIVNNIKQSTQTIFNDEEQLYPFTDAVHFIEPIPNKSKLEQSDYQLIVQTKNYKELKIHLVVNEVKNEVLLYSERMNDQPYIATGDYAKRIIEVLQQ